MGRLTISSFLWQQLSPLDAPLYANLEGKNVIVTGANTGIGFEVAKHFARMKPARLIVACRNEEKGKTALGSTFHDFLIQYLILKIY